MERAGGAGQRIGDLAWNVTELPRRKWPSAHREYDHFFEGRLRGRRDGSLFSQDSTRVRWPFQKHRAGGGCPCRVTRPTG